MRHHANGGISFILPVSIGNTGRDSDDLKRLDLLLTSFLRCFSLSDLSGFWIASPPGEVAGILRAVRSHTTDERFKVVSETFICPELADDPDTADLWPNPNKGWYRQQLIKLAACEIVDTPFYVTLDADVVCARAFGASDLVRSGRALCGIETAADYRALYVHDFANWEVHVKEERIEFAERILGAKRPDSFRGSYYAETPVVFSADAMRAMARRLEERYVMPWRRALLTRLPWTEQALFFHFLEVEGLLDRYYRPGGPNAVLRLYDSLWQAPGSYLEERNLQTWNVARAFSEKSEGYFIVVQSYLGNPADEVERRIMPFLRCREQAAGE